MKFYNNIFASAYQLYNKYYEPSTAISRAIIIVVLHFGGGIFLLISILKKVFTLDFTRVHSLSWILALTALLIFIYYLLKYYTKERVESILRNYEKYGSTLRKTWGFITLITLILEYVLSAFLLSK